MLEAAKRELYDETGYVSNELFIIDEAFTSPGIDNSKTYIVLANNCVNNNTNKVNGGSELINYALFSRNELEYMVMNNIMSGSMNKLAYYNLVNNLDKLNYKGGPCKILK